MTIPGEGNRVAYLNGEKKTGKICLTDLLPIGKIKLWHGECGQKDQAFIEEVRFLPQSSLMQKWLILILSVFYSSVLSTVDSRADIRQYGTS